jgi:hypothetical protein
MATSLFCHCGSPGDCVHLFSVHCNHTQHRRPLYSGDGVSQKVLYEDVIHSRTVLCGAGDCGTISSRRFAGIFATSQGRRADLQLMQEQRLLRKGLWRILSC